MFHMGLQGCICAQSRHPQFVTQKPLAKISPLRSALCQDSVLEEMTAGPRMAGSRLAALWTAMYMVANSTIWLESHTIQKFPESSRHFLSLTQKNAT
jgi:hypothetical protein